MKRIVSANSLIFLSLISSTNTLCIANDAALKPAAAKVSKANLPTAASTKKEISNKDKVLKDKIQKPKILPWKSFQKKDDERTYNIFKYNMTKPTVDPGNPEDWRKFDPLSYSNRNKLLPQPIAAQGLGPAKYPDSDFSVVVDPAKTGFVDTYGTKMVFAHQGTPMANGWLAPKAGYAYQMDGMLIYGTTNYTPVNYNGCLNKFIGVNRVPVEILSASGAKQALDLSRLVFNINDDLLTRPHTRVYPSIIYLKPGESASIQGHGTVPCPRPEQTEQVVVATPSGDQAIKVICAPDNAIIPGKVSP